MPEDLSAMHSYYEQDKERDRLSKDVGRVELARTIEVISRTLPDAPAVIADVGGGPGCYTDWLVELGHHVIHRDVVPHHVEQVRQRHGDAVDSAVGDARGLDLPDESVDVVLLLGPLYHLMETEATGAMPPIVESGFTGYAHRPDQLRSEIGDAGFEVESLVSLEGIAFALSDIDARMDDHDERALLMETLRTLESIPELLGLGPHLLCTARS